MDELHAQVSRARRRLVIEQFLKRLIWCLFATLAAAVVAVAVPRLFVVPQLPAYWTLAWLIGACVVGVLAAVVWTAVSRRSSLDAAIEIDERFGLRERVASGLSLPPEVAKSEAGRAVLKDAIRHVRRVDVSDGFRVRLDRRSWLPLVPAAIAFLFVIFLENRTATSSVDPKSAKVEAEHVKESFESLRKKIAERSKNAEKKGLKEAGDLFKQIEKGTRDLTEKPDIDRKKATVKLNDLTEKLDQRRQKLGGSEALRKQLQNLKDFKAGPAEKLAQAVKDGDWQKALQEVDKMKDEIAQGKLDEKAKQQLMEQLQQMKDKLAAAAKAHQRAMDDLKKQIEQQQRQGNLDQAGQLQQKLDQLAQQKPQMDMLQQLANQMGQIQQGLKEGDAKAAADALAQLGDQLAQMQQQMDEMEMLDAALDQLQMAKNAMACPKCQGQGCEACQGGNQMGMMGMGGRFGNKPGMGMGKGRGMGPRPDEENATNLRDTRVRQNPGKGAAVFGGLVEGPNVKGQVAEAIKEEMASLHAEPAEAMAVERLSRSRREHAEQYFRTLREGE